MKPRTEQTFDEAWVQRTQVHRAQCPVCENMVKVLYRLDEERGGGTCGRCFAGWLHESRAQVTVDGDT